MRSERLKDGSSFERTRRGVLGSWRAGIVAFVAFAGCANTDAPPAPRPEAVDLSPLLEARTDPSIHLASAFPDYEALVIGGIWQSNGQVRTDGVVDLVTESYDSELDPAQSWIVEVSVTRFDTPARAARDLDGSCSSFARGGAAGHPIRWQDGTYCVSSVVHRGSDPLRLYLPVDLYSSWLLVRNDRIVVRMYERHDGSPKSAKNQIIAEIADRLSKLKPASAAH